MDTVDFHISTSTKTGTFVGAVLNVAWHINQEDLMTTTVLASVGAVVSFTVSLLLKLIVDYLRNKKRGSGGF